MSKHTITFKGKRAVVSTFGVLAIIVAVIALVVLMFSLQGWALMIALGMLAGYTSIPGLAIGFWASWALGFLFTLAFKGSSLLNTD